MKLKKFKIICAFMIASVLSLEIIAFPMQSAFAKDNAQIEPTNNTAISVLATTGKSGTWIKESNGKWWYKHADGSYTKYNWEYIDGKWYFFDGDGWMRSSQWLLWKNDWYYLSPSGARYTGWLLYKENWYYLNSNGVMETGWIKVNGKEYFLLEDGRMHTGWLKRWNGTFYLNTDGSMQVGWKKISGSWYYFETSGKMQTGWITLNDKEYYLNDNGVMQIGWKKINNNWYYFETNGVMRTANLYQPPRYYTFKSNGMLNGTEIKLTRKQQEKTNWCWAASSLMVGAYTINNSTVTQSDIVKHVKKGIINEGGNAYEIAEAIQYASGNTKTPTVVSGYLSHKNVVKEIDANQPFVITVKWTSKGAHAVVCSGYNKENGSVYLIDPWEDTLTASYNYYDLCHGGVQLQ